MELKDLIISVIVVGMVVSALAIMISEWNSAYNVSVSKEFNSTFNKMEQTRTFTEEMKGALTNSTTSMESFLGFMATGAWKVLINMLWTPITIITSLISSIAELVGIPPWFVWGVVTIIIITVVFIIIGIIFRRPM